MRFLVSATEPCHAARSVPRFARVSRNATVEIYLPLLLLPATCAASTASDRKPLGSSHRACSSGVFCEMAQRPPVAPLSLFTETRASVDSPKGSIIQIQVSPGGPFSVRQRSTRKVIQSDPPFNSQEAFNAHFLASTASIHHSRSSHYPRSFSWRVIDDHKTLELRSVDPSKSDGTQRDAIYTLHLCFGSQLKQGGVALADTDDPQTLNLLALTRTSELYTILLHKPFFCHAAASEEDPGKWCKIARPSTFSASSPHRLQAASSSDLLVSLSDGTVVHLARGKAADGSKWIETRYGGHGMVDSLRGFVRWQGSNTVRYDGITLEQNTPLNVAMAPNGDHIFAICMDHTLKAWSPKRSAAVFSQDLLWQDHDPHDMPKVMINPAQASILEFITAAGFSTGDLYYVVTFSPHDLGQFKIWGVRDPDSGDLGIRDVFSDTVLLPPDPDLSPDSKAIWRVVDLKIRQKDEDGKLEFWLLMGSNRQCKLFRLQTGLEDLPSAWNKSWIAAAVQAPEEQQSRSPLLAASEEAEGEAINTQWLRYLFAPGRYNDIILESGLSIYCVDRGLVLPSPKMPLARRLVAAIILRIAKDASETGHEAQPLQIQQQWTILWQQISDLNRSRYLAPSLALDKQTGMPWIAFADGCSSIRSCTRLEIMAFNAPDVLSVSPEYLELPSVETESGSDPKLPDELALVISTAATFRQSFSDSLRQNFDAALSEELWSKSHLSMPKRVERFSASCDFETEIEDGLLDELVHDMLAPIEGLKNLASDAFFSIMESFKHFLPEKSENLFYTKFGHRLVINGARDIIYQRETILLDLLALVVIVDDIDPDEYPMPFFDGPQIFEGLVSFLRKIKVMSWLVDNVRSNVGQDTSSTNSKAGGDDQLDWRPTILETAFAVDLKPQSDEQQSSCEALNNDIQDLLQWVDGGNATVPWDEVLVHIQCNLLVHRELELAKDFQQFLPGTPWATYVRGRLSVLLGEIEEAAVNFQKAASRLCEFPSPIHKSGIYG